VDYREVPMPGDWEMFEAVGYAFYDPVTPAERKAWRDWAQTFQQRMGAAAADAGVAGMMLGLCAHESRARRISLAMRGWQYQRKDGQSFAHPLAWLQPRDILAYHTEHRLPWLRIYETAEDPSRERSELCFIAADGVGDYIRQRGMQSNSARTYPALWRQWRAAWGVEAP
jgi:hypothetical protein